ncbi:hypothetical protein KW790_02795 [Candidatus Parcubacteria bacterium]|nr:hypothetical protein [Candidatus Parcubacteria bacterium]
MKSSFIPGKGGAKGGYRGSERWQAHRMSNVSQNRGTRMVKKPRQKRGDR